MLKNLVGKLLKGQNLSRLEASEALSESFDQESPVLTAAMLALLSVKGETADELMGFVDVMRKHMIRIQIGFDTLDIVGTGGDGLNTVNISTGSAILAAACGIPVAKHGNRSSSSLCGAADVLEYLGVSIDLKPEEAVQEIKDIGISFLFAPVYHPALKKFSQLRKELGFRTILNILGPLINPAEAPYRMVGVSSANLLDKMASVLQMMGVKRALVFFGNGMDEISCAGISETREVTPDGIKNGYLDPAEYSLPLCTVEDLKGSDKIYNAEVLKKVLEGHPGPIANTFALNAGVGLYIFGKTSSIKEGVSIALNALQKGDAFHKLQQMVTYGKHP